MYTVFDVMTLTTYAFLQIKRGGNRGNTVVSSTDATGVFKLRSNMTTNEDSEDKDSGSTLHVRPDEPFLAPNKNNLDGHGVLIDGVQYEISGFTGGKNYHDGVLEHYTCRLQETSFVEPSNG